VTEIGIESRLFLFFLQKALWAWLSREVLLSVSQVF